MIFADVLNLILQCPVTKGHDMTKQAQQITNYSMPMSQFDLQQFNMIYECTGVSIIGHYKQIMWTKHDTINEYIGVSMIRCGLSTTPMKLGMKLILLDRHRRIKFDTYWQAMHSHLLTTLCTCKVQFHVYGQNQVGRR